jgi:gamma-glutamyl hercynylcysteine S-oxide synthase
VQRTALLLLEKTLRFKPTASETVPEQDLQLRRQQLQQDLQRSRALTLSLFEDVDPESFCHQAHSDFSPVGWHLGHIAFTEALWLLERGADQPPLFPQYRQLFAADGLPKEQRTQLPGFSAINAYLAAVRGQVLERLETAPLATEEWLWHWLIQHESQHCETIRWVLQLQRPCPAGWMGPLPTSPAVAADSAGSKMVLIATGACELGNDSLDALDNERSVHTVELPGFWLDQFPVTQGQYQGFIEAGGYRDPRWWSPAGWRWLQEHPVSHPLYWTPEAANHPVCGVSWYEADAYARFVGKRLPTEAEWEKAASWNPVTAQRQRYPWGTAAAKRPLWMPIP